MTDAILKTDWNGFPAGTEVTTTEYDHSLHVHGKSHYMRNGLIIEATTNNGGTIKVPHENLNYKAPQRQLQNV